MDKPAPAPTMAEILAALKAQMTADFEQQKIDIIAQLRAEKIIPEVVMPIDVAKQFAEFDPGIGRPAGNLHEVVTGVEAAVIPVVQEEMNAFVWKALHFIHAKLDALVQVTGHGNSAAMASHL